MNQDKQEKSREMHQEEETDSIGPGESQDDRFLSQVMLGNMKRLILT